MYLWIKAFHIVFIASWFAGLFYLPRIYVNLAQETDAAATTRLLGMARRLYRFTSLLAIPALLLGVWLWLGFGIQGGWLHAKLALVVLAIGYHHACGSILKKFEAGVNQRSHTWFRYFNEVPVVLLTLIVILVVVKPF
jgi:putative membrane protein